MAFFSPFKRRSIEVCSLHTLETPILWFSSSLGLYGICLANRWLEFPIRSSCMVLYFSAPLGHPWTFPLSTVMEGI